MLIRSCRAGLAVVFFTQVANAAPPDAAPIPAAVAAMRGCWRGAGVVMSKAVTTTLTAKSIVRDAMFVVEVDSSATADARDRYAAHLIFGGTDRQPTTATETIVGFWADSFGGAFAANGIGVSRPDGFDITYQYPDDAFVNRWRLTGNRLSWKIVARDRTGTEKPFASYELAKTACPPKR